MMKVMVLLETIEMGGPAKNLLDTLALLREQIQFTIVTYLRGQQVDSPFIDCARDMHLPVSVLREKCCYDPSAILQLRTLVNSVQPDIIQIHNTKSRLYGVFLRMSKALRNIPQIHYVHGETWVDAKQIVYNHLDRLLFRRSRHIVVVSTSQREKLTGWGVPRERIRVIHNAINIKPFHPKPPSATKTILCVGRLSKEKGHVLLVEAIHQLVAEGERGFKLVLVGDGPERQNVGHYVRENSLHEWIEFAGYQPDPEPYYDRADLFVLPSLTEGFPNVLLEAALHYVPMISFAVGGVTEAFRPEREIVLLRQRSKEVLADAIRGYLRAPDSYRQMSIRARQRVELDYTMQRKAEKLLQFYQELVN